MIIRGHEELTDAVVAVMEQRMDPAQAAAIMGHPAAGIAWLVNKLSAVDARLEKGRIVLAGSFTRPVDIEAGGVIHADYGPLGAIGVSFV
jgi:2-oxo-hept-3-ene-1,7-dioate hydratase